MRVRSGQLYFALPLPSNGANGNKFENRVLAAGKTAQKLQVQHKE